MATLQFNSIDPLDDGDTEELDGGLGQQKVHIRIQQRNGRKTITTVQGIDDKYDKRKIVRCIKKYYNCNGTTIEDEQYGEVIQLTGDQRQNVADFLSTVKLAKKDNIKVHGF